MRGYHYVVCCQWQVEKDGPWTQGTAFVEGPGLAGVKHLVNPDSTPVTSEPWNFKFLPWKGCIQIPVYDPQDGVGVKDRPVPNDAPGSELLRVK